MSAAELRTDPRPTLAADSTYPEVAGWRCVECAFPLAMPAPWCPICRSVVEPKNWGPGGRVWSSTVLRVPLPGREPPIALAYVDLDDGGPRVLGHVDDADHRITAGTRLTLSGRTKHGDLLFSREVSTADRKDS